MNVNNPTYYPELSFSDINRDENEEIIVILTTGSGSGVLIQEVHVFHRDGGGQIKEIRVEDPVTIAKKNVATELTKSEAVITVEEVVQKVTNYKLRISSLVCSSGPHVGKAYIPVLRTAPPRPACF
ncbi:hypothetical protein [Aquibacillus salsiterrae]|uniref:PliI family lysozyme inhibitor of I-type lysozyme n=1 Tax=Aquibacillus salsiterrae TaxID=2950439 RepID=A0A9X3WCQ4_9BACI|nr:hypothetical protein [Aquibacillus salsiterrae]MDC3416238.1 PliI family lysozyme inhibitor of I-type lysozyme [Aquibacillus salsiterrae]